MNNRQFKKLCYLGRLQNKTSRLSFVQTYKDKHYNDVLCLSCDGKEYDKLKQITPKRLMYQFEVWEKYKGNNKNFYCRFNLAEDTKICMSVRSYDFNCCLYQELYISQNKFKNFMNYGIRFVEKDIDYLINKQLIQEKEDKIKEKLFNLEKDFEDEID